MLSGVLLGQFFNVNVDNQFLENAKCQTETHSFFIQKKKKMFSSFIDEIQKHLQNDVPKHNKNDAIKAKEIHNWGRIKNSRERGTNCSMSWSEGKHNKPTNMWNQNEREKFVFFAAFFLFYILALLRREKKKG